MRILYFRYDEYDSIELSDSNITPNTNGSQETSNNPPYHKHPTRLRHASTHNLIFSKKDSIRNPLLRHKNSAKQCSAYTKSGEVVESITTSFNERIPTPKIIIKSITEKHSSSPRDSLNNTNNSNNRLTDEEPEAQGLLVNDDIAKAKSHSDYKLSRRSEPHIRKPEPVFKKSSTLPALTDETNFRTSSLRNIISNKLLMQKRQLTERKQDTKAARTLSAILLAFICTWSPYMAFTLTNAFRANTISSVLYSIGKCLVVSPL